ncbi:ZP domain-containing protein [Dicentrarchus labrax]|uniref:ZP domain-containing protein n=1 Tax=Dicentrarchus labrax TaxID=13489 RepID=UPI0021F689DD|nr:ZP domain-containing protein [Dicentrarchus labrax]
MSFLAVFVLLGTGLTVHGIKSNVVCTDSTMKIEVEKAPSVHEDHLKLNDPAGGACSLKKLSTRTHIIAVFPLTACGTQMEEDDNNLFFKNELTMVDDLANVITRRNLVEVRFYCQYPKRGNVTLGFTANRKNITVWEKGFGTFTYQFFFYPDDKFKTSIPVGDDPQVYNMGDRIYMQIEATSTVRNTELFVETCIAAPYNNPNTRPSYTIIENGCEIDMTLTIHSSPHERKFRFSMDSFKFIGLYDQVYIICEVMMCKLGNPNSRCSKGCVASSHRHGKREAVIQSALHRVSQGPIRLKRSAELTERPVNLNLNLNLVFIAGCLLATVGMISGAVVYRAKVSGVKYHPLAEFDT